MRGTHSHQIKNATGFNAVESRGALRERIESEVVKFQKIAKMEIWRYG